MTCILCHTPLTTKHLRCPPCQREVCRQRGIAQRRAAGAPTIDEWKQIRYERSRAPFGSEEAYQQHEREKEAVRSARKYAKRKALTGRGYYPKKQRKKIMSQPRKRGPSVKLDKVEIKSTPPVAPVDITGHTVKRIPSLYEAEEEQRREEWRRWLEAKRGW